MPELDTAGIPDPDLIIRTSGEERLVELPALAGRLFRIHVRAGILAGFQPRLFFAALENYAARDRRFGGLSPQRGRGRYLMQQELQAAHRFRHRSCRRRSCARPGMAALRFRLLSAAIALLVYYEWSTITRLARARLPAQCVRLAGAGGDRQLRSCSTAASILR